MPLKFTDQKIPTNNTSWLNDNLMTGAHRLFCSSFGHPISYQSVLNWQKNNSTFSEVSEEHIQLFHNGASYKEYYIKTTTNKFRIIYLEKIRITNDAKKMKVIKYQKLLLPLYRCKHSANSLAMITQFS